MNQYPQEANSEVAKQRSVEGRIPEIITRLIANKISRSEAGELHQVSFPLSGGLALAVSLSERGAAYP